MNQLNYLSIIDIIDDLQTRGFHFDFNLIGNRLLCAQQKMLLTSDEFDVLEMHYFNNEDPMHRQTVVYGIESPQYGLKGILLNNGDENTPFAPSIIIKKIRKFWN